MFLRFGKNTLICIGVTCSLSTTVCALPASIDISLLSGLTNLSELEPLVKSDDAVDINQLFQEAYQAYTAEDYPKAEAIYRRILQLNPDAQTRAVVYNKLGESLGMQGKFHEAIEAYRNSLLTDPNSFLARVNIGTTQYQMGQPEAAQVSLGEARKFLPEKVESLGTLQHYISLSTGLRQIEQFPESIQIIRQAISLNPYVANAASCQLTFEALEPLEIPIILTRRQYRAARCELSWSFPDARTWQEELEVIRQTIHSTIAQQSKYAETYKKVGLEELSVVALHTLFEPNYPNERLDEAYSITHFNLGVSLLNRAMLTGDLASMGEAITSFQNSLEYDRNYPWTYLYLSIALIAQGQLEEAIPIARQALQLPNETIDREPTSTHPWAHNILGYALELQGNSSAAAEEYQSALQLDEAFTPAQNNLQEIQ